MSLNSRSTITKKPQEIADEEDEEDEELFEHHRFTVDPGQSALRVDKFLNDKMANISRNKIQDAALSGFIRANDKPVKSNYKVKPSDVITVMLEHPKREIVLIPQDIPLNIMYEDDSLLIVNKEPGMVVHPSYGHYKDTLVNALAYHLLGNRMFKEGDDIRPGLVHRIDKNTSGLLVIAKTEAAKTHLSYLFHEHTINRRYIALVWGSFSEPEGTIIGNLGRHPKNRKLMYVFPDGDYGKHAVTHYKVLQDFGYVSLIECRLETGRTHQIRVHMQYIGHPLFNDPEYGGDKILKGTTFTKYKQFVQNCFQMIPRQALHAKSLGFVHPVTREEVYFESELPDDMKEVIEKWSNYTSSRNE